LDLLEVKKKLKKGLPTQVLLKRKVASDRPQAVAATDTRSDRSGDKKETREEYRNESSRSRDEKSEKSDRSRDEKSSSSHRERVRSPPRDENEEELLRLLGDRPPTPPPSRDYDRKRDDQPSHKDRDDEPPKEEERPSTVIDDVVIPEEIYTQLKEEDDPILKEKEAREELLWDFKMMARKYPNRDIPVFTEHDDLATMRLARQRTLKEIQLDKNISSYKGYMSLLFYGMEYLFTRNGFMDMKGFAMEQIKSMNDYEELLIELGEKDEGGWTANLPVELRLALAVLKSAAMFWIIKIVERQGGPLIASVVRNLAPGSFKTPAPTQSMHDSASASASTAPSGGKKMRGPSVRIN
jgi:hypothetical protein